MPYRVDHTQYGTASAYEQLYSAIVSAAEDMPPTSNRNKADFTPLTKIKSREELVWTLEYVRNVYEKRIPTCTMRGAECLLIVDDDEFHPVFLLATLYVLLWAGAEVHVCGPKEQDSLHAKVLSSLASAKVVFIEDYDSTYPLYDFTQLVTDAP